MMLPNELFGLVTRHRPIVCIDLLLRDAEGRLLVGLRKNRPAQGTWFVPGGNVRKDERLADAFSRITTMELGTALPMAEATFVGVFEHFYPDNSFNEPGYGLYCGFADATSTLTEANGRKRIRQCVSGIERQAERLT